MKKVVINYIIKDDPLYHTVTTEGEVVCKYDNGKLIQLFVEKGNEKMFYLDVTQCISFTVEQYYEVK